MKLNLIIANQFCLSLGPSLYLGSTVFDVVASSFRLEFKKWKIMKEETKNGRGKKLTWTRGFRFGLIEIGHEICK